jgi:type II secretory pathway component PulF
MEFSYRAKKEDGSLVSGTVDAESEDVAISTLHQRGFVLLDLAPLKTGVFAGGDIMEYFNKPKTKDVVAFTRQLSTLIEADIPLAEGVRILADQMDNKLFARVVGEVSESIQGGMSLSNAFALHPKQFSTFYVKLVKAGEASGRLQESLKYLAEYLERSQAIGSKVRNALAYPVFVIVAMIGVFFVMVVYVLPQLLVIFKDAGEGVTIPITTRMLIGLTDFVNNYLVIILVAGIAGVGGMFQWLRSPDGTEWWDTNKIRIPLFGSILKALFLARIADNMTTLIKSDIAILDSLRITSDIVDNVVYQDVLLEAEEAVRGGGSISDVFRKRSKEIPALMTSMIAIGERTGKIDYMLSHVSKFYGTEAEGKIDSLATLIEPVLVVVLGAGVAVLVSSILLPLYSMVGVG